MQPYYQDNLVTLYQGDCLEIMPRLDTKFDLVLTDPPYLISDTGGGGAFGTKKREYLKIVTENLSRGFDFDALDMAHQLQTKINSYVFCSKNQIKQLLEYYQDYNYDVLVYHKKNPTPTCNNKYLSDIEYIIFARQSGVPLYGDYSTKSKLFSQNIIKNQFEHPTVKPLNIIKTLILNSTKKGDIILDIFAGSGTTGRACKDLQRKCVLIEKEQKYCEIIVDRLKQEALELT